MLRRTLALAMLVALPSCGDDQPQGSDGRADAATGTADLGALPEVAIQDIPTQAGDAAADAPSDIADRDATDAPLGNDDAPSGPTRDGAPWQVGLDLPVPSCVADGGRTAGTDASYAELYPCRDDSDCCILVSPCGSGGYGGSAPVSFLYSRAPGAGPLPCYFEDCRDGYSATEYCNFPAEIQLWCIQGQCVARTWGPQYPSSLLGKSHCGHVEDPRSDMYTTPDPDKVPTDLETSWRCPRIAGH